MSEPTVGTDITVERGPIGPGNEHGWVIYDKGAYATSLRGHEFEDTAYQVAEQYRIRRDDPSREGPAGINAWLHLMLSLTAQAARPAAETAQELADAESRLEDPPVSARAESIREGLTHALGMVCAATGDEPVDFAAKCSGEIIDTASGMNIHRGR